MAGDLKELDYAISFDINDGGLTKALSVENQLDKGLLGMATSALKVDDNISKMINSTNKASTSAKGVAEALGVTSNNAEKVSRNADGITSGLNKSKNSAKGVSDAFKDITNNSTKSIDAVGKLKGTLASVGIGFGITAGIKSSVTSFADFEQQMAGVHATLGKVSNDDMTALTNQAVNLSNKWGIAARDVAEGEENLASAGFTVTDILNTMEPSLLLATAGQIQMGAATSDLSSTIRSFGLDTKASGHVVDSFAQAAAQTNAQMGDMAEAMKYAAQPAHAFGWSLEQTEAAIGALSNNAIKGSTAGTTLREMFSRLINPSEDAYQLMHDLGFKAIDPTTHKIKSLGPLIGGLQKSLEKLNPAQRNAALAEIFGQEALTGVLALVQTGPEQLDALTKSFENSDGAAKQMAQTQNDTLAGSLRLLKTNVQNTADDIAKETGITDWIKNVATDVVNNKDTIVSSIKGVSTVIEDLIGYAKDNGPAAASAIGGVVAALATFQTITFVTPLIGGVTGALESLGFAIMAVRTGTLTLGTAMLGIMGPPGWIALAVGGAVAAFMWWQNASKETKDAVTGHFYDMIGGLEELINYAVDAFNWLAQKINFVTSAINKVPIIGKMLDIPQMDMGQHLTTASDYFAKKELEKRRANSKETMSQKASERAGVAETILLIRDERAGKFGYADGTSNATSGLHLVGERGPELLMFGGGEKVIPANATSALLNQTNDTSFNSTINDYDKSLNKIMPKFTEYGKQINNNLGNGIIDQGSFVNTTILGTATNACGILNAFAQSSYGYGSGAMNEMSQGVTDSETNLTTVVQSLTDKVVTTFKEGFGIHSPSRIMYSIGSFLMQGLVNGMSDKDVNGFLQDKIGSMIAVSTSAMGGNVSAWLTSALAATGTPLDWLPGLLKLVSAESGGDPNNWNPQSVGGEHATGLLQTLPSTFKEFMQAGMNNILNPVDNAASAINYIKSRYGSVYNTPLFRGGPYVGYANGTDNATSGLHLVGERGPEILAFNGGEKVLDNNKTQQIFSQSKPYNSGNKSNYITVGSPTFQVIVSGGNDPKATAIEVDKTLRRKFSEYFNKEMEKTAIQMGYATIGEL